MVDGVNQQPGLFQRIGNFFGAGDPSAGQRVGTPFFPADPNAASPTDPFAGLSRPQRTMLGFAALRDAAGALEGRDTNFFQSAMGGFEQARERERLRAQGILANQVQALQAIGQIENEIGLLRAQGVEPTQAQLRLRDLLYSSVEGQMPSLANVGRDAVQPAPSPGAMSAEEFQGTMSIQPGGSSDISGRPTGAYTGEPEVAPDGGVVEPTASVSEIDRLQQEVADLDERIGFINARQGDASNLENQRDRKLAQLETARASAVTAQQEAEAETRVAPLIGEALDFLVNENGDINVLGARIAGTAPGVAGGQARLAASAIRELGAIAAMGSVRDARAGGFGGALSDADIALIQRSGGTFDLAEPEATVRTLRNIASQLSPDAQAALFGATGGAFTPSTDMQSLRDRYLQ